MNTVRLAVAWLVVLGPLGGGAIAPQAHAPRPRGLHPHMERLLVERGPSKAWVFLVDKGPADAQESLAAARGALRPRALERRRLRRTAPGLVDERDVPVHGPYVDAVLATGVALSVESSWLNAVSVRGDLQQLRAVARLPCVDRVEPVRRGVLIDAVDRPARAVPDQEFAAFDPAFYGIMASQLEQLNLPAVHGRGFTGSGVVVGLLDTGFHRGHEAFQWPGHGIDVLAEYDFLDDDGFTGFEPGDPVAQHNHGTMVLGTLAAYLPGELVGGAFDASFILVKTEDVTSEYAQEEDFYVAGLQFIEANGGDVASSSLGYIDWYTQGQLDGLTAVTTIAVNVATANGLHCCTAAGNDGNDADPATSSLIAPADAFDVVTCGAVDPAGDITSFSSDGPTADGRVKPELLARGVLAMTICAHQDVDCTTDTGGTSFATPLVACVVACLSQAYPTWSPGQMRTRLIETASGFLATGTHDPLFVRGYGIPDADLAGFGPFPSRRTWDVR